MKKKKNKKQKEKINLVIVLVAVASIIALIGGATFAYWQWRSANNTTVNFSVKTEEQMKQDLYANLIGGTTTGTSLKPTTCTSSNAVKKTVTIKYKNASTQSATVKATLSLMDLTIRSASYKPTAGNSGTLKYLKYALTTNSSSCSSNVVTNLAGTSMSGDFGTTLKNDAGTNTNVTFEDTSANNLPLKLFDVTFTAAANMTSEVTKTYYLYIWLDENYTHTNIGTTNSDPLQGLSFTVQWSGDITQTA